MGATNEEITLDILVCGTISAPSSAHNTSIESWKTARSINDFYSNTNSITAEMRAAPGVNLRYYF